MKGILMLCLALLTGGSSRSMGTAASGTTNRST